MNLSLPIVAIFTLNVLTPGASFVLTMQTTLAHGRAAGNHVACGLALSDFIYACAAILGMATLMQQHAAMGQAITLFGGGWIVYIGGKIFFSKNAPAHPRETAWAPSDSLFRLRPFRLGLLAGTLNPQAALFFTTVFIGPVLAKPSVEELVLLVTTIGGVSLIVRACMVRLLTIRTFRHAYLARHRLITRTSGGILIAFGLKILTHPALILLALTVP